MLAHAEQRGDLGHAFPVHGMRGMHCSVRIWGQRRLPQAAPAHATCQLQPARGKGTEAPSNRRHRLHELLVHWPHDRLEASRAHKACVVIKGMCRRAVQQCPRGVHSLRVVLLFRHIERGSHDGRRPRGARCHRFKGYRAIPAKLRLRLALRRGAEGNEAVPRAAVAAPQLPCLLGRVAHVNGVERRNPHFALRGLELVPICLQRR